MREVTPEEQAAILEVLRRNEDSLRAIGGVHYMDVGYKFTNGVPTDELAIRLHVHTKRPESDLAAFEVAPESVEGVPVDVIESHPQLQQNPRDQRFDPLVGGVAVRNTRHNFFGTLGMVVFDGFSSQAMGLSNHHVLVGNTGQAGDNITQPATTNTNDIIGTLTRWSIGLDCAVATLNQNRINSTGIVDYPAGAQLIDEPLIGTPMTKSGRTTETTFGVIDGVTPDQFTIIPDPNNPPPTGEISAPGDSGSIWLRVADNAAIGLHFAGEQDPDPAAERAWAMRMVNVAQALNIRLQPQPFVPVYAQGSPGNGIGGYDLGDDRDRVFAFDYDRTGRLDHLVLYRPGTGTIWILRRR